jgi:ATP-dependent Clp protease protease subunit
MFSWLKRSKPEQPDTARHILLGSPVDDEVANIAIAKLLYFQAMAPHEPVSLYVNSPGGSVTASLAILDTMAQMKYPIKTTCLGIACGTAAMIVAAGERGQRFAVDDAHFGFMRTVGGKPEDDSATRERAQQMIERMNARIVRHFAETCRQHPQTIIIAMENDRFLTALEARSFRLVDHLIKAPPSSVAHP